MMYIINHTKIENQKGELKIKDFNFELLFSNDTKNIFHTPVDCLLHPLGCMYLTLDARGELLRIIYIFSSFLSLRSCNFLEGQI